MHGFRNITPFGERRRNIPYAARKETKDVLARLTIIGEMRRLQEMHR